VVAHAAEDAFGRVKVLLIAKSLDEVHSASRDANVCLTLSAAAAVDSGREALLLVMSAPSVSGSEQGAYHNGTSPTNAEWMNDITYAGQSFSNSTDGRYVAKASRVASIIRVCLFVERSQF
jgi:hypothetical protein